MEPVYLHHLVHDPVPQCTIVSSSNEEPTVWIAFTLKTGSNLYPLTTICWPSSENASIINLFGVFLPFVFILRFSYKKWSFVTSQTRKLRNNSHDAIFFRWQLWTFISYSRFSDQCCPTYLWILYGTKLIFIREK